MFSGRFIQITGPTSVRPPYPTLLDVIAWGYVNDGVFGTSLYDVQTLKPRIKDGVCFVIKERQCSL